MASKSANRYSPEFRERAVRMLLDQRGEYRSEHAAIHSLAPKIGCSTDTLRTWLRQHERDAGDGGLTTSEQGLAVRVAGVHTAAAGSRVAGLSGQHR